MSANYDMTATETANATNVIHLVPRMAPIEPTPTDVVSRFCAGEFSRLCMTVIDLDGNVHQYKFTGSAPDVDRRSRIHSKTNRNGEKS